ncbi:MAG: 16S rRNA (uracil(1498)-N(3))-methyltransferase [Deltaproteobacteria bacterium]|nr:16S rRNA (uracil(1498)-N(3))-methyltransferase [Deltaproteobacteria bacterium]
MSCRVFAGNIKKMKAGAEVRLTGEESKYVARVLRLKEEDRVILSSLDSLEYHCIIKAIEKKSVLLTVDSVDEPNRESPLEIILCQALPKSKKMDLIVQKATELGVKGFIPFVSSRAISRPDSREGREKIKRWEKLALEAARQCGRTFIPPIDEVISIDELFIKLSQIDDKDVLKIIPWESEDKQGLKELSEKSFKKAFLLIGPEGGFSPEEVEKAKNAGFIPLTLGNRLLRTETAGFAVISMMQYIWGDMG